MLSLALSGFNAGIRGYYFTLAALAWLLGPGAFALATTGIVVMLLWRQFGSEAAEAIRLGADHIVVGRPITGATDPREAAERIVAEIAGA